MTKTTPAYKAAIDMLAARRKALHLRQADVDRLAGWADGYTGKVECGLRRLSLRGMVMYARALGCHLVIEDAGGSRQLNAGTTDIFLVTALADAKCALKTAENPVHLAKRTGQIDNSLESLRKAANDHELLNRCFKYVCWKEMREFLFRRACDDLRAGRQPHISHAEVDEEIARHVAA